MSLPEQIAFPQPDISHRLGIVEPRILIRADAVVT
jgi:hypothetical protein